MLNAWGDVNFTRSPPRRMPCRAHATGIPSQTGWTRVEGPRTDGNPARREQISRRSVVNPRKRDRKCRSCSDGTSDGELAAMVLHDAFADVQPQTRSTLACSLEGL